MTNKEEKFTEATISEVKDGLENLVAQLGTEQDKRSHSELVNNKLSFQWEDIVESIGISHENGKCSIPRNWMTIRGVLQWYISNNMIKRSYDMKTETYEII